MTVAGATVLAAVPPARNPQGYRGRAGSASRLEFKVLGDFEVWRDGHLGSLEAVQPRTILGRFLLTPNRPVATRDLLDSVWGRDQPRTARAVLHNQILRLRQLLEPDPGGRPQVLCTSHPGYLLRVDPEQVDLCRFQRLAEQGRQKVAAGEAAEAARLLREALAMWRGQLLADVVSGLARRRWPALTEVEALRAQALEARVEADLRLGHTGVMPDLGSLLRRDPFRPPVHGLLIRALHHNGRRDQAVAICQEVIEAATEIAAGDPDQITPPTQQGALRRGRA